MEHLYLHSSLLKTLRLFRSDVGARGQLPALVKLGSSSIISPPRFNKGVFKTNFHEIVNDRTYSGRPFSFKLKKEKWLIFFRESLNVRVKAGGRQGGTSYMTAILSKLSLNFNIQFIVYVKSTCLLQKNRAILCIQYVDLIAISTSLTLNDGPLLPLIL